MSYDQVKAINNPAQGLMIYCTDCSGELGQLVVYNTQVFSNYDCTEPGQ